MGFLLDHGVRYLALDIDGTLYPRRMLNARMVRSSFPSLRLALAFNKVRTAYRREQEERATTPPNREGLLRRQASMVAGRMGSGDIPAVQAAIDSQFYAAWERSFLSIKPFAHLRETLLQAKEQGVLIVVLSDFPIARKLETLGIEDLVDMAFSSEESGYLKPHPSAFALILDALACPGSEVLYVGDSYSKDCVGAKGVGMHTALIGKRESGRYPDADMIVNSWKELAALIL